MLKLQFLLNLAYITFLLRRIYSSIGGFPIKIGTEISLLIKYSLAIFIVLKYLSYM